MIMLYAPTALSALLAELDEMATDLGMSIFVGDEAGMWHAWRSGQRHTAATYGIARAVRLLCIGSCEPDAMPTVVVPRSALDPAADPGIARRVLQALYGVCDALVAAHDRHDTRRGGRRVRAYAVEDDVGNIVVCEQLPGPRVLSRAAAMSL